MNKQQPQRLALAVAIALLLAPQLWAQKLENGDLSKGPAIWKGDRQVKEDPADPSNKILVLKLRRNSNSSFYQKIETGGASAFEVTFQVKPSEDYKGSGVTVRVSRSDGWSFWDTYPVEFSKWKTITHTFSGAEHFRSVTFAIDVKKGEGELFFDNFVIKKK